MPTRRKNKGTFGPLILSPEDEYLRGRAIEDHNGYWLINKQYLHRIISNPPEGTEVDHINRNRADNRRDNLRNITRQQNAQNMSAHVDNKYSGYKGVSYLSSGKRVKRWRARIQVEGKEKNLGYFLTEQEAVEAAKEAHKSIYLLDS